MISSGMPAFEISPPRELSRGEIKQLRRGELAPAEAAVWLARARGLGAPTAPEDGDLPPNGIGWLVSVDPVGRRLHPRLYRAMLCCAVMAAVVAKWADLLVWYRPPLVVAILLGALLPLVCIAVVELAAWGALQRRFARAVPAARLDQAGPGELVCLSGVVAAQPTVPTLFRGVPAVLFRDCIGGADEVRGIDFELELDGGASVRVCARRAFLVDRPTRAPQPPACGPVYAGPCDESFRVRLRSAVLDQPSPVSLTLGDRYESSIGPGDRVEVAGVLHRELAPEAAQPFARFIPTRFVLRASADQPLLVRRSAPATSS
jgi:hypothetical protein